MATTARTASFGPYALDLRSGELRKFGMRRAAMPFPEVCRGCPILPGLWEESGFRRRL